jgi:hypothetical protein
LNKVHCAAVFTRSNAVGRDLEAIFEKCHASNSAKWLKTDPGFFWPLKILKFQMPIAGKGHKNIAPNQQENGRYMFQITGNEWISSKPQLQYSI